MVERILILILTVLCCVFCLLSACLAVWYLLHGAVWSAILQLIATLLTLAGAQVGIWWLKHFWRN